MTILPKSVMEGKRVITCRKGGYENQYGAIYLPMDLVDKYRLIGTLEVIEDEQNHLIILKKFTPKPKAIDDE
jgi:hypothetical protein